MFKYLWIIVLGLIFCGMVMYTAYLAYKYIEENNGFDLCDFVDYIDTWYEPLAAFWYLLFILAIAAFLIVCVASAIVFFKGE